jgi:hypothetical protein
MSTSPIVSDQLHKKRTTAPEQEAAAPAARLLVPTAPPKPWASVELPSLNLSDPIGTVVAVPIATTTTAAVLKKTPPVPTLEATGSLQTAVLDSGLSERMAQLRATSAALSRQADVVRRTTGTLK